MNNIRINKNFLLPENLKFSLSLFKKPFCSKEKKKFKRYETVKFKNKYFTKKFTNLKKKQKNFNHFRACKKWKSHPDEHLRWTPSNSLYSWRGCFA